MSNLPYVKEENRPPNLRFVQTAMEDKIASEQTGKTEYMDVIKVYIRAAGDSKTEVPDIAKMTAYDVTEVEVKTEREITEYVEIDGETREVTRKIEVPTKKKVYAKKTIFPWKEKLQDRLKNNRITREYYDHCIRAFEGYLNNQSLPIEGTPLVEWAGASEAMKRKAIEIGINSVEKCSEMTEEAILYIGMGARAMKDKAAAFVARDRNPEKFAQEFVNIRAENDALSEQNAGLQQKLAELQAMIEQRSKPGPKPKQTTEAA